MSDPDDPGDEEYEVEPPESAEEDLEPGDDDGGIDPPETGAEEADGPEGSAIDPDDRDGPLADVAAEVERLRDRGRDAAASDLFEDAVEDTEVDREELWRQVAGEDAAERVAEIDPEVEAGDGPRVERPDAGGPGAEPGDAGGTERVVEKKKYCQKCEYFSPPPNVRCTHEGTTIAELVDVDTFRVIDCPVVAEDEELERF